ncbi:pyridine nucleotide-disulfide oxidoreductase domain-containing protein 1-like [Dreissena polymorpha]|uniref:Pyridine nucleotide-disulfide oxidoreductase domain-containing protein 1 n=1 Tax=Dreissena polymorpha TaxID=45954 RepID=A0A9D4CX36_DREPO|nr:pyridine nucleotide-disulfide oxidoreductase domain-containing protein 1-like [Dreissena polymorpha]KAH3734595.1 hypothetical protein DPMN_041034 [Dreissena polymorpha]
MSSCDFLVLGGGIAGVTCAETLSALCPSKSIFLLTASKLIKAVTNYHKVTRTLEQFDVEERHMSTMEAECANVKVIQKIVKSLDTDKHEVLTNDGSVIQYGMLCICTGAKPKVIADNPHVLGIRDTESVQAFQRRLHNARRIIVVGNGGIATELVYEVEGCDVIWAIKDASITSNFIDPGAAQFCLPGLNADKKLADRPIKRLKYTEQVSAPSGATNRASAAYGSALGPDWMVDLEMTGSKERGHRIHVDYEVEVAGIYSPTELSDSGKSATAFEGSLPDDCWPVYVELTNKKIYGCDFVVSATGVVPNTELFAPNNFSIGADGGINVDSTMQTSIADVYAAGDVCNASWEHAPHWLQMRLWSQARQMGAYAAKCMVARSQGADIHMDFCFELFAHVTKFFNYKVILLGKFNAQDLQDHELLLRVTKGEEYVKVVLQDNRMQGAVLIGDTNLEETFENLILNQTDLTLLKEHLLEPNVDIEDYFD